MNTIKPVSYTHLEPASATIIGDYDIALGRDLTQYNMGLVAHDKDNSYIDGIAFEDNNNNGKYRCV